MLILDEFFDLALYRKLELQSRGELRELLANLVRIEAGHLAFWEKFFRLQMPRLGFMRRVKLWIILVFCAFFGERAIHLVLEAIEVNGIRKYLAVWEQYRDTPLGAAVREVLREEIEHEDAIISGLIARNISPERVQNIFLGFNDGLVEMLGAVSGFFAAFESRSAILLAACTVAVAGAFSMGAGVFAAFSSENEVRLIEEGKRRFLGDTRVAPPGRHPALSGLTVGASYFIGAFVPIVPVLFGAHHILISAVISGVMVVCISAALAFLSGMNLWRRIALNVAIIAAAVAVTYAISIAAKRMLGV